MDDTDKVTILNGTSPGFTPQEPLALVAQMSDSERSALESEERGGLGSAEEPDTTAPEIRYCTSNQHSPTFLFVTSRLLWEVYYLLYADDYEIPSKVANDPEEPSIGRIRADSVAPPHSPISIKRCISRVERKPSFAYADLFTDTSCDTPLKEGHISILFTDGPGLSPDDPMAIVQVERALESPSISDGLNEPMAIAQAERVLESLTIPDGRYVIKNRAGNIYWDAWSLPITLLLSAGTGREKLQQLAVPSE